MKIRPRKCEERNKAKAGETTKKSVDAGHWITFIYCGFTPIKVRATTPAIAGFSRVALSRTISAGFGIRLTSIGLIKL